MQNPLLHSPCPCQRGIFQWQRHTCSNRIAKFHDRGCQTTGSFQLCATIKSTIRERLFIFHQSLKQKRRTSRPDWHVHATRLQMKVSLTTFGCAFSSYLTTRTKKQCPFLKWQMSGTNSLQLAFTKNTALEHLKHTEFSLYCNCQIIYPSV